jgi:replicative DNA helicase
MSNLSHLTVPATNVEAECAVLGAILVTSKAFRPLFLEEGLRAEHFYRGAHRAIYQAMCDLDEAGGTIDALTVTAKLKADGILDELEAAGVRGKAAVDALTGGVPNLGGVRDYAKIVIAQWVWRRRQQSANEQLQAIARGGDEAGYQEALVLAQQSIALDPNEAYIGPTALADHMMRWLSETPEPGLPFPPQLSGLAWKARLRAGHTTVVSGWSSSGKSMLAIQLAAHIGSKDHRVVYWTNEDTAEEIAARRLASVTGISKTLISDRNLSQDQIGRIVKEMPGALPIEVMPCYGWDPTRIARSIRQEQPKVAVVDHLHNAGVGNEEEINRAMQMLVGAAGQTGTHLVLVSQLKNARYVGVCRPRPVAGDLRGSGQIFNLAHTVLLVHLDEEEGSEDGRANGRRIQLDSGSIDVVKNKPTGELGTVPVDFDRRRLVFVEQASGR